ncbi:hypothetical protein C8R43DRAFT_945262 [Mycena crocata]|nr:hypothetical protein C8R43DRAFT_945262 [Mycena crocata]
MADSILLPSDEEWFAEVERRVSPNYTQRRAPSIFYELKPQLIRVPLETMPLNHGHGGPRPSDWSAPMACDAPVREENSIQAAERLLEEFVSIAGLRQFTPVGEDYNADILRCAGPTAIFRPSHDWIYISGSARFLQNDFAELNKNNDHYSDPTTAWFDFGGMQSDIADVLDFDGAPVDQEQEADNVLGDVFEGAEPQGSQSTANGDDSGGWRLSGASVDTSAFGGTELNTMIPPEMVNASFGWESNNHGAILDIPAFLSRVYSDRRSPSPILSPTLVPSASTPAPLVLSEFEFGSPTFAMDLRDAVFTPPSISMFSFSPTSTAHLSTTPNPQATNMSPFNSPMSPFNSNSPRIRTPLAPFAGVSANSNSPLVPQPYRATVIVQSKKQWSELLDPERREIEKAVDRARPVRKWGVCMWDGCNTDIGISVDISYRNGRPRRRDGGVVQVAGVRDDGGWCAGEGDEEASGACKGGAPAHPTCPVSILSVGCAGAVGQEASAGAFGELCGKASLISDSERGVREVGGFECRGGLAVDVYIGRRCIIGC